VKLLEEAFKKEIVQRIVRNLLDVQILRLVEAEPMWGYRVKKEVEARFGITLRHGALYPLLNELEREGFLMSRSQRQGRRMRKVYKPTEKGERYLEQYINVLQEQIRKQDIKRKDENEKGNRQEADD
jgi:DNA-binding PadR family transcriptional regulator